MAELWIRAFPRYVHLTELLSLLLNFSRLTLFSTPTQSSAPKRSAPVKSTAAPPVKKLAGPRNHATQVSGHATQVSDGECPCFSSCCLHVLVAHNIFLKFVKLCGQFGAQSSTATTTGAIEAQLDGNTLGECVKGFDK